MANPSRKIRPITLVLVLILLASLILNGVLLWQNRQQAAELGRVTKQIERQRMRTLLSI